MGGGVSPGDGPQAVTAKPAVSRTIVVEFGEEVAMKYPCQHRAANPHHSSQLRVNVKSV
jgi:hypothetical protein